MSQAISLTTPLERASRLELHCGDRVLISGTIYTARDAAHRRLCRLIEAGEPLPIELRDQVIYYVGPTPAPPGRCIGSAGPTTSSRMDRFAPSLFERGLAATIGKGYRGAEVRASLQAHGAVHLAALGGAGALLGRCITAVEVVAYEDLGAEAIRRLTVRDFPATVAYDAHGRSIYPDTEAALRRVLEAMP